MPIDKKTTPEPGGAPIVESPEVKPVIVSNTEPANFDLAEDLLILEKMNLLRAVMLRMQGGRHPQADIDALLKRRMNLPAEKFQGPFMVRLICTLLMIFAISTLLWGFLWAFATAFELSYFVKLLSTGFATMIAAMTGVAIFQPSSLLDEKLLKEAIRKRLDELRSELPVKAGAKNSSAVPENSVDAGKQNVTTKDIGVPEKPAKDIADPGNEILNNKSDEKMALEGTENFES